MEPNTYSIVQLFPEFSRVLNADFASPEGLSATIVAFLLFVLFLSLFFALKKFYQARQHLKFYKNLLEDLDAEQLLAKRRDISNKALESEAYGRLWREFDESLVHIPEKQRLCNTLDAEHFFNTHTLARGLTENRLFAAVPGFLTAIGVIGTFAGLQMGLSQLSGSIAEGAAVDELKGGIFGMIGGASIAFMTSVWGVITSLLFNFGEKALERHIRAAIASFQNDVDYLYPRITAEQSLSNIEHSSRESVEKLAELDEKIGHRMQEAMQQASTAIREGMEESLSSILGPAISKLVENAHSGSEKALEGLMSKFMDGLGNAGQEQQAMIAKSSEQMREASAAMTQQLDAFTDKMGHQFEAMVKHSGSAMQEMNESLISRMQEQEEREIARQSSVEKQVEALLQQSGAAVNEVSDALSQRIKDQEEREIARQGYLDQQVSALQSSQQELLEGIEGSLKEQMEQQQSLLAQFRTVASSFEALSQSHTEATDNMKHTAVDMKTTANQLGLFSAQLKESVDYLGEDIDEVAKRVQEVTQLNQSMLGNVDTLSQRLGQTSESITQTSETLKSSAELANNGMHEVKTHFDQLGASMREHVRELESQVGDLLTEYSQRVSNQTTTRLNEWNENTNNYISMMTDAVNAISNVVDEIEGKVGAPA